MVKCIKKHIHQVGTNSKRTKKKFLFFRGAIFETTYNKEGKSSNTQKELLFELPTQESVIN